MSGQPSGEHCSSPGVDCNTKRCLQIKADDSWNDEKCTDWNQYYCYARPACYTCTAGGNDCGKWRTQRTCTTSQDSTCVNCAGQCAAREEPAATGCTCSSCAAGQTYKAGLSSVAVAEVWAPNANLKRDWFMWKTRRWENCPTQLVACLGDLKGWVNDQGHWLVYRVMPGHRNHWNDSVRGRVWGFGGAWCRQQWARRQADSALPRANRRFRRRAPVMIEGESLLSNWFVSTEQTRWNALSTGF